LLSGNGWLPPRRLWSETTQHATLPCGFTGGSIDRVINIPIEYDEVGRPDGYHIRCRAVDAGIPLITDLQRAQAIIEAPGRLSGRSP
jgi:hypothetical protein